MKKKKLKTGKNSQKWSKRSKMVIYSKKQVKNSPTKNQNGLTWSKMVKNGQKQSKMVKKR